MRRGTVVLLSVLGVAGALIVAGFVTRAVATDGETFRAPSENMLPTVEAGDEVTLDRGAYDDARPEIGDIVIHHPPLGAESGECGAQPAAQQMCSRPTPERADVLFIMRIVAGPGERVSLEDGIVVRDGEPAREPYVADCGGVGGCDFPQPITIPEGHYLVLGDNRGASDDSRFWGPIPLEWIQGRVEDCDLLGISCSPLR